LSAIENGELGEQALLKEVVTKATEGIEKMEFKEFVHMINMVFPYIHREQILMWTRARYVLRNTNPFFSQSFVEDLGEAKESSVFFKVCDIIKKRIIIGKMKREEFF
jgi:hypothetical protein